MIHIAERPQQISFSKNPIVFKVQNESNGELIVSSGAKSSFRISLLGSGGPTTPYIFQDGQVLTLTLSDPFMRTISQSFTFKNSPGPGEIAVDAPLIDIFQIIKKTPHSGTARQFFIH